MELIIQILMLFILLNGILKLSFWRVWQTALAGLLIGGFIILVFPYSIAQSKTALEGLMASKEVMQNMAVLITIDSALCLAFCFAALKELFGNKGTKLSKTLHWYVSLLMLPVVFYLLTFLIFSMPGTNFKTIAWSMAITSAILIPLLGYGAKLLLPEKELRLEAHFLVSIVVAVLGLICTVNGSVTYSATEQPLNLNAILLSAGLFVVLFLLGFLLNKFKFKKLWK